MKMIGRNPYSLHWVLVRSSLLMMANRLAFLTLMEMRPSLLPRPIVGETQ